VYVYFNKEAENRFKKDTGDGEGSFREGPQTGLVVSM